MNQIDFQKLVKMAQQGDDRAFKKFYQTLLQKCRANLYEYGQDAIENAFSETMYRFWERFIEQSEPLPNSNIAGYIFKMTKYYLVDEARKKKNRVIVSDEHLDRQSFLVPDELKESNDYLEEQEMEKKYHHALAKAIHQLGGRCKKMFQMMIESGLEKPRDLWKPLGYNNARTLSTVKSDCQKRLKVKMEQEIKNIINQ